MIILKYYLILFLLGIPLSIFIGLMKLIYPLILRCLRYMFTKVDLPEQDS